MARGSKDYDKVVRKVNKGQKSKSKIDSIHKMLESLITDDTEAADENLHDYLQAKMRELIIGEGEDCDDDDDDKDDKDSDDKDDDKKSDKKKDKKDDDDDEDEKVEEQDRSAQFARSGSVMSDAINGKIKFKNGGKKTMKKIGSDTKDNNTDLDKTEFSKGGKQPAKTLEKTPKPAKFDDGREFELGTTDK
jgi:hypothetical protein